MMWHLYRVNFYGVCYNLSSNKITCRVVPCVPALYSIHGDDVSKQQQNKAHTWSARNKAPNIKLMSNTGTPHAGQSVCLVPQLLVLLLACHASIILQNATLLKTLAVKNERPGFPHRQEITKKKLCSHFEQKMTIRNWEVQGGPQIRNLQDHRRSGKLQTATTPPQASRTPRHHAKTPKNRRAEGFSCPLFLRMPIPGVQHHFFPTLFLRTDVLVHHFFFGFL